jgi:hypothetical protein
VKAYLDALQGLAYGDDRRVAHLVVHRYSPDHPALRDPDPAATPPANRDASSATGTSFFAEILSLDDYVRRFDLAHRRTMFRKDYTPWWGSWRWAWQRELGALKGQRLAMRWRGEVPSPEFEEHIRFLEEDFRLGGAVLAFNDRPGPPIRGPQFDRTLWALRRLHNSAVLLPLPGQHAGTGTSWKENVRARLRDLRGAGTPLSMWVGLDIAVRGTSLNGKDLDNLAHAVLVPFEEELCVTPGTVSCYRVYRAAGEPEGVQVRMMKAERMLDLEITISKYGMLDTPRAASLGDRPSEGDSVPTK